MTNRTAPASAPFLLTLKLEEWHAQLQELTQAVQETRWEDVQLLIKALHRDWFRTLYMVRPFASHEGLTHLIRSTDGKLGELENILPFNRLAQTSHTEPSVRVRRLLHALDKLRWQLCAAYYHPSACNELLMRDLDPAQILPQPQ